MGLLKKPLVQMRLKPCKATLGLKEIIKEAILEGEIPNEKDAAIQKMDAE